MTLKRGTRSTWADVVRPDDVFASVLSDQGDGTGVSQQATAGVAVTGATNASPIVVTATAHGKSDGDLVAIVGVGGNTAANIVGIVANKTTNTFELTDLDGNDVAGNGAYTSGGVVFPAYAYIVPANTTALIQEFDLYAADTASGASGYMALAALTNGMALEIWRDAALHKTLTPTPVTDFANWDFVAGLSLHETGIAGNSDAASMVRGSLAASGGVLRLESGDVFVCRQNDDLSGLDNQKAVVSGVLESTT